MDERAATPETLADFARSSSYGQRSDLTFKFLPRCVGSNAGVALASILTQVGGLLDTATAPGTIERVGGSYRPSRRS